MHIIRWLLGASIVVGSPLSGFAEVGMPDGGRLPDQVVAERDEFGNPVYLVDAAGRRKLKPAQVWVAYDGFVPTELPGDAMPPAKGGHPIPFMTPHAFAGQDYQEGDSTYRLLVRPSDDNQGVEEYLGWINTDYLIERPVALRDPVTRVFHKGMIINNARILGEDRDYVNEVEVRLAPRPDSDKVDSFRLFTIFFVYAASNDYVLLGANPYFDPLDSVEQIRDTVLGWVSRRRVSRWDSREAVYWNWASTYPEAHPRRTRFGKIWLNPADAYRDPSVPASQYAASGLGNDPPKPLYEETVDDAGVSRRPPRDLMRFPVLSWRPSDETPSSVPGWELLKVGVVGGFYNERGEHVATKEQLLRMQTALDVIRPQVGRTELLFVLDDTASMKKWFSRAADVIEDIVRDVRRDKDRNVRVGVAYYNDTAGGEPGKEPFSGGALVDAAREGDRVVEELRQHRPVEGGDPRELVFGGIMHAIEKAGFSPNARKMVFVLGDMGDKSDENAPKHQAEREVVRWLTPKGQCPIEFYAIQVLPAETVVQMADALAFQTQMRQIARLHDEATPEMSRAAFALIADAAEVRAKILERYRELVRRAEEYEAQIEQIRRGQWGATRIGPELLSVLAQYRVDIEKLRATAGAQVFQEGYVWIRTGRPRYGEEPCAVEGELLLKGDELQHIITKLQGLRIPSGVLGATRPSEVLMADVQTQLGQQSVKGSWEDVQLQQLAVKVQSPLLRKHLDTIRNTVFDIQEMYQLELKRNRLIDIKQSLEYEYKISPVEVFGGKVDRWFRSGKPTDRLRAFHIGGNELTNWYWINKEREWP